MRKPVTSAALAGCLALAALGAVGQTEGADCARSPGEHAVCAAPALRALDARMAAYYQILREAEPVSEGMAYREFRDELAHSQTNWRSETRDRCGAQAPCLEAAYRDRIAALRKIAHERLGLTFSAARQAEGPRAAPVDYANATYRIEDEEVKLVNGERSEPTAPGSATQHVTRVFGKPVFGRFESKPAAAVWLLDDPGGSGTSFYVAVAFGEGRATNAVLLGDRIRPQQIAFQGDAIVVTFLDRKPDDPMVAKPTVRKSVKLRFDVAKSGLTGLKPDVATRDMGRSGD